LLSPSWWSQGMGLSRTVRLGLSRVLRRCRPRLFGEIPRLDFPWTGGARTSGRLQASADTMLSPFPTSEGGEVVWEELQCPLREVDPQIQESQLFARA